MAGASKNAGLFRFLHRTGLSFLERQIRLMLNLKEEDQRKLDALIAEIASNLGVDFTLSNDFEMMHLTANKLSRDVLRREWDRVKETIKIV
jgi:hypothetical protein